MTNSKKKRMSMLDSLAAAGAPSPTTSTSMMSNNRALRSARDAVDGHRVWDLDPAQVLDDRLADRLDPKDVADLREAIEANGQTVPILVRRHPSEPDRYLLVYGRRRLEAIRTSEKVEKVRALVANLDDDAAVRAQISENMARRDLSYIEKALFSQELIESNFGTQAQVAEVLTVTKSSISMALTIVDLVGADLIRAIGPAHGIGRPRWDALGRSIEEAGVDREALIRAAEDVYTGAQVERVVEGQDSEPADLSVAAFEAVAKLSEKASKKRSTEAPSPAPKQQTVLTFDGARGGAVKRSAKGLAITLDDSAFADWMMAEAQDLISELHTRWKERGED
ncbi:plasmid partitioning protein RepB [Celeribacter neptunius]|uniref:Chromosome partitioning protein, ParB family n=1 Tax=Celeribacter neptunius TaxID=588602 RepID=A0A1I3Y1U2_9RHOB|nr:plasmid partitioning protein RepB [Celeribacter neptunius]SFK25261.1 chromosome partitioning protein, ParB family [Celeribacter neptunius]